MSIRPLTLNGLDEPETSFEELNTTLPRFQSHETLTLEENVPPLSTSTYIPPPSSVGTSDTGTVFSNSTSAFWSNKQADDDQDMEVDQDDEFLNDFQEFQNKKDDFDDAIKTNFHLRNGCRTGPFKNDIFAEEFDRKLSLEDKPRLKQPRSMMELKPKRKLSNSVTSRNLRSGNSVRFKKSMPNLALVNPAIREEEEDEEREREDQREFNYKIDNDTQDTILAKFSSDDEGDFLTGFEELEGEAVDETISSNDKGSADHPRFLKKSSSSLPLKISPAQYDIVKHDELLTPGLHRRQRDWNTQQELDSFKEKRSVRHCSNQNVQLNGPAKIKTIKQQIDHNTPMKKGSMIYNPKTMKWEGNENVLSKFSDVDTANRKALLIKNKLQRDADSKKQKYSDLQHARATSRNQKVIGNMILDEQNLRWVSVSEEEADPFAGIPEINLPPVGKSMKKRSSSPFLRSKSQVNTPFVSNDNDGVYQSTAAQARLRKYHSMRTLNGTTETPEISSTFHLSSRALEKFYHEENRWCKKLASWFIPRDETIISVDEETIMDESTVNSKRKSYMYEIRNMVINSTKD
ncbi:BBL_G0029920.mRNA.1.CDS.1 [Saccharomyces cerevisiae]|nr:BBL_G0029920.mRNA.1.CDS.1 [Saccharomyces cerevisiae]CAI7182353.1 BBL_G0029920.mRNA.1.CDS.1 [Saccharomyces cerevisiae]